MRVDNSNIFNFHSGFNGNMASPFSVAKLTSEELADEVLRLARSGYSGEDIVNTIGEANLQDILNDDRKRLEANGIYLYNY